MLTFKNDLKPLLQLAIPLVLKGLTQSSVFFFETLFFAHLSHTALAAGALVTWLFGTMIVILLGTLASINVLIAHKHGENDPAGISFVLRDGFLLALLVFIPAFLLSWYIAPIFLLLGQHPIIVSLATLYTHALAWGLLPNFIMIVFLELLTGIGKTKIILFFSLLSVPLNICFSYLLIFGKFGLPAFGIAGAGWGMTITNWIMVVIVSSYVLSHKKYKNYFLNIFNRHRPFFLMELLRIGVPMGAMFCVEVAFFFALTLVMGSLGPQILAANQITLQYLCILMSIIFSIAQAVTIRMGHLLGAKDYIPAERANYAGLYISGSVMAVAALIYWLFPEKLIALDFDIHNANNLQIIHYAKQFFLIAAIFQILEALRISLFGTLRALKDTHFTLITSIIGLWCIALPLGYFAATYLHWSGNGLWWGMVVGVTCNLILLLLRFQSKMKVQKKIVSLNIK